MTAPLLTVSQQGLGVVPADLLNTYEQTCDNIAQLRAFIGKQGVQVAVRGSVTPGDGGGGIYWWNASGTGPDNNNTVIVPTGAAIGAWNLLPLQTVSSFPQINVLLSSAPMTANYVIGPPSTDATATFNTALGLAASENVPLVFGPGTYNVLSSTLWPGTDGAVQIDTGAEFTGGGGPPILTGLSGLGTTTVGLDFAQRSFDSTWANVPSPGSNFNVMHFCRTGISNGTTGQMVVIQGSALANFAGTISAPLFSFAAEFSAFANASYTNVTGLQVGCINNQDSTVVANGIVISSLGTGGPVSNAINIKSRQSAIWQGGIEFDNSAQTAVSGDVFAFLGTASSAGATNGIHLSGLFSASEMQTPSLKVGPSTVQTGNYANRVQIQGAATGTAPTISVFGDTNLSLSIAPAGTGSVLLGNNVSFGVYTSDGGSPAVTGYITITDSSGNSRKVATIT